MKIVIPYYSGNPRIERAIATWNPNDIVLAISDEKILNDEKLTKYHYFYTTKTAKSLGIGETTKPFIVDMLYNLIRLYPNEDYYGFFNSDIILPPNTLAKDLITDKYAVIIHHRSEVSGEDDAPVENLQRGGYIVVGKDGFIFHKNVIGKVIKDFPDMVVGAPQWDTALALWLLEIFGEEEISLRYGDVWHSEHKTSVDDKAMYKTPEAIYNNKILNSLAIKKRKMTQPEWLKMCNANRLEEIKTSGSVGIIQPGRTGDIIICLPIAKWYYDRGYKVIWPVMKQFMGMFEHVPYVEAVETANYFTARKYLEEISTIEKIIDLGIGFGRDESDWYASGLSFDEWKYKEANVPFKEKYNLQIQRNPTREELLFKTLMLDKRPNGYVVTHSRTDSVSSSYNFAVPQAVEVVPIPNFTIFDWLLVLEKAELILCVDSCVANLINQLGIGKDRRYFRPWKEVYKDSKRCHMRTPQLASNWKEYIGVNYCGIDFPPYINDNNAMGHIVEYAKNFCIGKGADLGGGANSFPGSTNVDIKEGQNIEELASYGENLDYIFSSHFLEHANNPFLVLKKCFESLKEGGKLFLYLPHPNMIYWRPSNPRMQGTYGHKHTLDPKTMIEWLTDIGFIVEKSTNDPDYYYSYHIVAKKPSNSLLTFIFIVLNGMPFIKHAIKSVYDSADKIIIVEGAVKGCMFAANKDGSSTDGTVEYLKDTYGNDPKVKLIQGKWNTKLDMHNAALEFTDSAYFWLVDADEFWKKEDIEIVKNILAERNVDQIWFSALNFWKDTKHLMFSDTSNFIEVTKNIRRVFKYCSGMQFVEHRPPSTNMDSENNRVLDGDYMKSLGVMLYHYGYLLPSQVNQKIELYRRYGWGKRYWMVDLQKWYEDFFLKWTPENKYELESKEFGVWSGDKESFSILYGGKHPDVVNEEFFKDLKQYS